MSQSKRMILEQRETSWNASFAEVTDCPVPGWLSDELAERWIGGSNELAEMLNWQNAGLSGAEHAPLVITSRTGSGKQWKFCDAHHSPHCPGSSIILSSRAKHD